MRIIFTALLAASSVFSAVSPDFQALLGFEKTGWKGIELSEKNVKEGKSSGLWKDHLQNKSISIDAIDHDWSGYNELRLWMFSEKNTGESLMLILNSRKDPKVFSYYSYPLTVNWDGWKEIKIPFKKFSASRDPAGWKQIDSIMITADGWGLKPNPESVIWVDDIRFVEGAMPEMKAESKLELKKTPMPDMSRVKEIAAMLPEKPEAVLLPPVSDRKTWESIDPEKAKQIVENGERQLKSGMTAWSDDDYLAYTRSGKRTGDGMMGRRTGYLRDVLLAECIENKGRFIAAVEEAVKSIASDKSWTLSAHDGRLDNYNGKRIEVDLSAAARALVFSGTYRMLGEKLLEETRITLTNELYRRIFNAYKPRLITGEDRGGFWWMNGNNNWNAVCHAGVVLAALAVIDSAEERALFVHGAEIGLPYFLHGMTDDGYCSEGIGYWGYGFGNFVLIAAGVSLATKGKIDWFNNAKVAAIGRFGKRMELIDGLYPAYADCGPTAKPSSWILYFMDRMYDPAQMPTWQAKGIPLNGGDPQSFALTFFPSSIYYTAQPYPKFAPKAGDSFRDFFEEAGILNCRPKDPDAPNAFAASFKGGHNAEEHNHNDLGSFVIATKGAKLPLIIDPGNEVYTARTFSAKRYDSKALSSFGHSVPVIDGVQQRPGRDAMAKIVEAKFSDDADRFVIDYASAYDKVDGITGLKRTFIYKRAPEITVSVSDTFEADRPMSFSTAVLTYDKWLKTAPDTFIVYNSKQAVEVKVDAGGEKVTFREDIIDEDMGYKASKPLRIGIDLEKPVKKAVVTLLIRKVDPAGFALPGKVDNEGRAENLGVFTPDSAKAIVIQAEDFTDEQKGKVAVVTKIGDSGKSFKLWDEPGHALSWKFSAPSAGDYGIRLRYCSADAPMRALYIDGKPAGQGTNLFCFAETGGWSSDKDNWRDVWLASKTGGMRFNLAAGEHTLTFVGAMAGMNMDWIKVVPATGKDILNANPSFDDADNDGKPEGWLMSPGPNGDTTKITRVTADGKPAMHIVDNDKKNGVGLQQMLEVKPGRMYRERAMLKGAPIALYFVWYDADKKQIGKEMSKRVDGGTDAFKLTEYSEQSPANAAFCKAWIYSWSSNTGETYVQSFEFEDIGAGTAK